MTTTPDEDLLTAAWKRVAASAVFQNLVSEGFIGTDDDNTPWLFQGLDSEGRPFRDPEGSGKGVVVLMENTWGSQNRHNTWQFPELQVLIYMDSTRNADGSTVAPDARRKCKHVAKRINTLFHLPGNTEADQDWEGFRVHGSIANGGLSLDDVPQTQATVCRGTLRYETKVD
jgi:hypothetical protein